MVRNKKCTHTSHGAFVGSNDDYMEISALSLGWEKKYFRFLLLPYRSFLTKIVGGLFWKLNEIKGNKTGLSPQYFSHIFECPYKGTAAQIPLG